jgi:hypothetical protein
MAGFLPTYLHMPGPGPPRDSEKEKQDDWEGIIETRSKKKDRKIETDAGHDCGARVAEPKPQTKVLYRENAHRLTIKNIALQKWRVDHIAIPPFEPIQLQPIELPLEVSLVFGHV